MFDFQSAMKCRNVMKCGHPIPHCSCRLKMTQGHSRAFEVQTYAASHRRHVTATKDWCWCGEAKSEHSDAYGVVKSSKLIAVWCCLCVCVFLQDTFEGNFGQLAFWGTWLLEAVFQGHHHFEILELSEVLRALVHLAYNTLQSIITNSNSSFQVQHARGQALPNVLPMAVSS